MGPRVNIPGDAAIRRGASWRPANANGNGYAKAHTTNGDAKRKPKKAADEATLSKGIEPIKSEEVHKTLLGIYSKAKPPITPEGDQAMRRQPGQVVRLPLHPVGRPGADRQPDPYRRRAVTNRGHAVSGRRQDRGAEDPHGQGLCQFVAGFRRRGHRRDDHRRGGRDRPAGRRFGRTSAGLGGSHQHGRRQGPRKVAEAVGQGQEDHRGRRRRRARPRGNADDPPRHITRPAPSEVLLAQLPYQIEKDHGKDLRDWLERGPQAGRPAHRGRHRRASRGLGDEDQEDATTNARSSSARTRPRVIDEAIAVLARQDELYQRGACLVQVTEGTEPPRGIARAKDAPRIALARHARIRELLAAGADWLRPTGDGELEQVHPPDWVVKGIDARGQWQGIRRLESVVEVPVLRADGSIVQTPGYDESTGLLFQPQIAFPPVADAPTPDDAETRPAMRSWK